MSDHIDPDAETVVLGTFDSAETQGFARFSMARYVVRDLTRAGLLVTPEHDAATAAKALRDARSDIEARIQTMQECGAHSQYMAALNDAWGLLSNRLRDIERNATT